MAGSKRFDCPICLELVYKPVVKECGHLFCFWCVYKSMNRTTVSHCPMCQKAYVHLPRICEQLHFLLEKIAPEEYARRASEVEEEESRQGQFSPQLEDITSSSSSGCSLKLRRDHVIGSETQMHCKACSKLVYEPIVLNCGHLFCQTCVSQASKNCPTCGAHHPGPFPQTCLELHHYLESNCPGEYTKRANELKQREIEPQPEIQQQQLVSLHHWGEEADLMLHNTIHRGVACDGCGMMPILGKRFSCSDCLESIGYNLCASCHDHHGINFPGRFNQKHGPQHRMAEKGSTNPQILLWSWS